MRFVDIIGDVVANVRLTFDPLNLEKPFYEFGHPVEIFNLLAEKSQSEKFKYSKYPLIALYLDYNETHRYTLNTISGITIAILTETSPEFSSKNRYDQTITPVLQPIYDLFMQELKNSKYIYSKDFKHTKINRLYYGKQDVFGNSGNIGNDALDAILITQLNLTIS